MKDYKLSVDDPVIIKTVGNQKPEAIAIVTIWPAEIRIGNIEMDNTTFKLIQSEPGCSVTISPLNFPIVDIKKLIVKNVTLELNETNEKQEKQNDKVNFRELVGSFLLSNLAGRFVKENDEIDISIYSKQHSFIVSKIITNKETTNSQEAYHVTYNTVIEVSKEKDEDSNKPKVVKNDQLSYSSIGGLEKELGIIREIVELPLKHPQIFQHFGLKPPRGVLLYGPPGTGKTLIARVVANELGCFVITINGSDVCSKYFGESEEKLREVFELAQQNAPSLIFIDEIDVLAPKRQDDVNASSKRIVGTLLSLMDGMKETDKIVILAASNQPNSIDLALRRAGRFDREVEIGIPSAQSRHSILNIYLQTMPHSLTDDERKSISDNTHGYVGADISQLCKQAALHSIKEATHEIKEISIIDKLEHFETTCLQNVKVTFSHFCAAMNEIRPSGMREIMIEIPNVKWTDIGGYDVIKQQLKEAVEWPLLYPEKFVNFGIRPPRGILLYGPPGCSKTLVAKALASEAGLNFIPVKGPELFSKYVGDSEKAVRDIFRKARAASPSIVFFDELDALAIHRGAGDGSSVQDRVLSQMLNELDGISPLNNVLFLAATNRPDIIDKALMRPGRIDRILFVPPPDKDARLKILEITTKKMKICPTIDLVKLSERTHLYSGAELVQLCNEAALTALRNNLDAPLVSAQDFEYGLKSVLPRISAEQLKYYSDFSQTNSGGMNPFNPNISLNFDENNRPFKF